METFNEFGEFRAEASLLEDIFQSLVVDIVVCLFLGHRISLCVEHL